MTTGGRRPALKCTSADEMRRGSGTYPVGAIVVTMAEGDDRRVTRHGPVAPSSEIRVSTSEAVGDSTRRVDMLVAALDVPMNRAQAGVRTDDPERLVPVVEGPKEQAQPLVMGRTAPERCDETTEPGSADRCG